MRKTVSVPKLFAALVCAVIVPTVLLQTVWMLIFVPSSSMAPTLNAGDLLVGSRRFSEIARGDIAVFRSESEKTLLIKRVIGLPGDEIRIANNGTVYVNGEALTEPYVQYQRQGREQTFEVPEGEYLMLGDNRAHSYDSRYWEDPFVPEDSFVAIEQATILTLPFFEGDEET